MLRRRGKTKWFRPGYLGVFLFFFATYLTQSWPWSIAEVGAAALGGFLVTALSYGMRESADTCYSLQASWFVTLASLLLSRAFKDCLVVLSSLTRKRTGEVCAIPFNKEAFGREALNAGHRAMVVTAVSVGPNTVVIDVDPDHNRLIVHQLVHTASAPGSGNRVWPIDP